MDIQVPPDKSTRDSVRLRAARTNLPVLILSASLLGAAGTIRRSLVQPLALHLGASLAIVGILTSISGLAIFLPMLIFGEYSDTVGRRRPMLIASFFMLIAGFIFWTASFWQILIPAVLLAGIALALEDPASSAATAESVSENRRGIAYGLQNSGRLLAGVVATLLAIIIIDRGGIQSAFLLVTLLIMGNLLLIYFSFKESHSSYHSASPTRLIQSIRKNWRPPTQLKYLYIYIAILDPLAFDTGWILINGLLTEFHEITSQEILIYTTLNLLSGGFLQLSGIAGRLADWSRKWTLVMADTIAVPTILICALFPSKQIFLICFTLIGFAGGFFAPAIQSYVVDHVPRERVASELGKF